VPFDQHPFSVAVNPFVRHPVPTGCGGRSSGRESKHSGRPPAVVAADPNITAIRRRTPALNDSGAVQCESQPAQTKPQEKGQCEQQGKYGLLHGESSLGLNLFRKPVCVPA